MTNHTRNRTQVSSGRLAIRIMHERMARIGTTGTQGVRNERRRSGCFRRSTSTPSETSTNANRVPMLERSASVPMSNIPAGMATKNPATQVLMCGVRKRGWTLEKICGSRPSRDMANHTRACPN